MAAAASPVIRFWAEFRENRVAVVALAVVVTSSPGHRTPAG
jgi:hypothetical protein